LLGLDNAKARFGDLGYFHIDRSPLRGWCAAYSTTAAYFSTRVAGSPVVGRGNGATGLSLAEGMELQQLLAAKGYDIGKADGIIGASTRAAVKAEQIKYGLPADSYPTAALLDKLRGG
jgi:peptidoglycan hydrolase-like protein with peptidoglycan-binding domain